jgi:hypothetical protein
MISRPVTRRALLAGTAGALAACSLPRGPAPPARLRLIGETVLPRAASFRDTTVGGLSAIDFDAQTGTWIALSDDRSEHQPARFYTLDVELGPDSLKVRPRDVTYLLQANGSRFPGRRDGGNVPDPEAARLLPGGKFLWTSEGDARLRLAPSIHETSLDGRHLREFAVPEHFRPGDARDRGPRNNLAFEGLALTPDRRGAWVAMEGPLQQDGPEPAVGVAGGPCRFTFFDVATGQALRQVAYMPDAIPASPIPPGAFADNGVSEVLMADEHRMLVLERAFMMGRGMSLRLFRIDTREGSDTLREPILVPGRYRPCVKTLLADFAQLGLPRLDNTEGMCWGPRLASGARTLVFVSDDNFNPLQVTQFVACEFLE